AASGGHEQSVAAMGDGGLLPAGVVAESDRKLAPEFPALSGRISRAGRACLGVVRGRFTSLPLPRGGSSGESTSIIHNVPKFISTFRKIAVLPGKWGTRLQKARFGTSITSSTTSSTIACGFSPGTKARNAEYCKPRAI